ncbi:MAG: 16S rRNA (uracil(1498)-N(3))-methyltransferase [Armatimonadetes bacterium]|nr:16S rRNA (uracil(1498)-N(3))-methyltransferase [Armatimonadota bacterium]
MHRFYVPTQQFFDNQAWLSGSQHRQIRNVLRLRIGDLIALFDGSGREFIARIQKIEKDRVLVEILESRIPNTEPSIRLTLGLSLLKGERMDIALQKCTEIGVSEFLIVQAQRSVRRISEDKQNTKLERWRAIVREAAEQSGRTRVPSVEGPFSFENAIIRVKNQGKRFIAWEQEKEVTLRAAVQNIEKVNEVAFFTGPEGSFTVEEIDIAKKHGATTVSLGPRILRAETAAIVGSALIIYNLVGM